MNKVVSDFLDRVTERLTALAAGLVGSRMASFHAADQAQQQSQPENLARAYEADDKPQIAALLRQRASRLAESDLVSEGVAFMQCVANSQHRPTDAATEVPAAELSRLPDFTSTPVKTRKQRPSTSKPHLRLDDPHRAPGAGPTEEPHA